MRTGYTFSDFHRLRCAAIALAVSTVTWFSPATAAKAAQSPPAYHHEQSGFAVEAPQGWRLLRSGDVGLPTGSLAGFINADEDILVYIRVEFIPGGLIPQDDRALDRYAELTIASNRDRSVFEPPTSSLVAGRRVLAVTSRHKTDGVDRHSRMTLSREGYFYFTIGSTSDSRNIERAATAHAAFQNAATISKSSDHVIAEIAATAGLDFASVDAESLTLSLRAVFDRAKSLDSVELLNLSSAISDRGRKQVSVADLTLLDSLQSKAISMLPIDEIKFLVRIRLERDAGRALSRSDREHMFRVLRKAYAALPPAEVASLKNILDAITRLGMEAYDASK